MKCNRYEYSVGILNNSNNLIGILCNLSTFSTLHHCLGLCVSLNSMSKHQSKLFQTCILSDFVHLKFPRYLIFTKIILIISNDCIKKKEILTIILSCKTTNLQSASGLITHQTGCWLEFMKIML